MNRITSAILAACLSLGTAAAFAQDAATKADTKKSMSTQDCKDHMNTATGQKRTDAPTAETDANCANMPNTAKMHKHAMKKRAMPADAGTTMDAPATPMK